MNLCAKECLGTHNYQEMPCYFLGGTYNKRYILGYCLGTVKMLPINSRSAPVVDGALGCVGHVHAGSEFVNLCLNALSIFLL